MNISEIFNDTRVVSATEYMGDTLGLIDNTKVYTSPTEMEYKDTEEHDISVDFIKSGTLSAARRYVNDYKVGALSFANANVPGGCPSASRAQEENLCQCTNLYESLISNKAMRYYQINNNRFASDNNSVLYDSIYTDTIIYSPNVLCFKNDMTYERDKKFNLDIITCPSPSTKLEDTRALEIYTNRIRGIFKVAKENGVECLVLGAWGCGVFGQNPYIMGKAFGIVLNELPLFKKVVFGVFDSPFDNNYEKLYQGLISTYEREVSYE